MLRRVWLQSLRQQSTAVEDTVLSAPESEDEADSYSTSDW